MKKHSMCIRISKTTRNKLMKHIHEKYQDRFYGAISREVEAALLVYLAAEHTQIHTKPVLGTTKLSRTQETCQNIIGLLKNQGFLKQFGNKDLGKAISLTCGSDYRTVRKWTRILLTENYIKNKGAYLYEYVKR